MFDLDNVGVLFKNTFRFLSKKGVFITVLILGAISSYFAINAINALPKPETVVEFMKYYFSNPVEHFKATLIILIPSLSVLSTGYTLIGYGITLNEFKLYARIIIGILGGTVIILSIVLFQYFIKLLRRFAILCG